MKDTHLLLASTNVARLRKCLVGVVDSSAIQAIDDEVCKNVAQLFKLGRNHYSFAIRQNNRAWRQKISRLYYGAYNISRAVRLKCNGEYSTDSSDHKKIEGLPADFNNKSLYENQLKTLREDRNLCDYDHTAISGNLILGIEESVELVNSFIKDAREYLTARGVKI